MSSKLSLTVQIGQQSVTVDSRTFSDANGQRFSDYIWDWYMRGHPDGGPEDTPANRKVALESWWGATMDKLRERVIMSEKRSGYDAVDASVSPLEPEPEA